MNNDRSRKWGLATLGTFATVMLAVPLCLGYVGQAFDIAKAPMQIKELQAKQHATEVENAELRQELQDIRGSLERIEHALRIQPKT